jgi:hypothetical protein
MDWSANGKKNSGFWGKYMKNSDTPVLKGQHNLAQGNALGRRIDKRIVREKMSMEKKFPFRTKQMISFFGQNMLFYSVRKKVSLLKIIFSRTGSRYIQITQGDALG